MCGSKKLAPAIASPTLTSGPRVEAEDPPTNQPLAARTGRAEVGDDRSCHGTRLVVAQPDLGEAAAPQVGRSSPLVVEHGHAWRPSQSTAFWHVGDAATGHRARSLEFVARHPRQPPARASCYVPALLGTTVARLYTSAPCRRKLLGVDG
jgi:hypothetical protein